MFNGKSYEEFILNAKDEEENLIVEQFYKKKLKDIKGLEKIKNLNEEVNLIVFSELYCNDAAIVIPILNNLSKSSNLLNIRYLNKNGNEELIKSLVGEVRIPTILKVNKDEMILGKYIEFPKEFKKNLTEENKEELVKNKFRKGIYNKEVEKELLELILN